ncbi:MAG: nuclear transport factor 2 family protein [Acidobacteria bacterium]|nr:nuclear transport factor 2 family protein [Acidobacteriota bacterium]
MRNGHRLRCFLFLLLVAGASGRTAWGQTAGHTPSEGEKLERQFWADMKAGNWKAVESRIAPDFQSVHPDGPQGRAGEISLIKGLNLGEYTLTNFTVTQGGDTLVVTYWVSVLETIDGRRLPTKPAMRMSIWKKAQTGWQWIAHANLNPM